MSRSSFVKLLLGATAASRLGLAVVAALVGATLIGGVAFAHTSTHGNFDAGWLQKCGESGSGRFDPIVYPGQPSAGHHHTFAGGTPSFNATFELLRTRDTTCPAIFSEGDNKSLYWIESYYVNGVRVPFQQVNVYYKRGNVTQSVHEIRAFPSGHKMIARKGVGKSLGQWFCAGDTEGSNGIYRSAPYRCNTDGPYDFVSFRIALPQCSDGRLDSADHMSHMRYASNGTCPSTHPIRHPRIMLVFKYETLRGDLMRQGDGSLIEGEHADAFSAWAPGVQQSLIQETIYQNLNVGDEPLQDDD